MLPRAYRLVKSADFSVTTRKGSRGFSEHLVVHHLAKTEPDSPRASSAQLGEPGALADRPSPPPPLVGFVIAKKQLRRAVDRNQVKRRLRHLMAQELTSLPPGSRTVVRLKDGSALNCPYRELQSELHSALSVAQNREQSREAKTERRAAC